MTTPNFKVLVHAMQLGQPSDPQASLRVLTEQVVSQQEEIAQLRREIALLQNRYAALTAVAEPEAPSSNLRREPAPAARRETVPVAVPAAREQPRSEPPAARLPKLHTSDEGEERDGSNSTVVISKGRVGTLEVGANAPFPIAPAGRLHRNRDDADIPGAPWATSPTQNPPVSYRRGDSGRPPPAEDGGGWRPIPVVTTPEDVDVTHTSDGLLGMAPGDPNDGPPPIPHFVDDDDDLEPRPRGRERSR